MGDSGSGYYQGSQAYAQKLPSDESISPTSGTVNFSKTLVHLRGVTKAIDLHVRLSYTPGAQGSFGFPKNWGLNLSFTIPRKSLTSQAKTFVVDPNWSDRTDYHSGLRYVNNHGMKFKLIFPPLRLPSGRPGYYSWSFQLADGAMEYFDDYGKLLEHEDIDGNSIYYSYMDPMSGPLTAKVDYMLDSWGQTIQFQYDSGADVKVIAPDGGETIILFDNHGVRSVTDAMRYTTSFIYLTFDNYTLLHTITFSTGLQSNFEYIGLETLDENGENFNVPACSKHYHVDTNLGGKLVNKTRYRYGGRTGGANYTGARIGCRMGGSHDSLMDSNNQGYRYDVAIERLDANNKTLQMSRIYYNYLHLSMLEEHYDIDPTGNPLPAYRAVNTYDIPIDQHARATSYSQPIEIEQFHYSSSAADYEPLRRATSTYDDFGCPLTTTESMWNVPTNAYILQKSITSEYMAESWGGEMLQSQIFADHITGRGRRITYELDAVKRHITGSSVTYREDSASGWKPWKTKSYTHDTAGRVTAETTAWSTGVDIPQGSVHQYTYNKAYKFDVKTGISTVFTTDPLGNTCSHAFQIKSTGGPLVTITSPLGALKSLKYDLLGRIIEVTDALGFTTKTSYSVGPGVTVKAVDALGYITEKTHDVLGRVIQVTDSGNQNTVKADRILSQTEYDAVSNVIRTTNELGLVATRSYDAFSRVVRSVDIYGNVTTCEHNDDKLTTETKMNSALRTKTFANGLGRPTRIISYGDSVAAPSYELILENAYDGLGNVTTSKHFQQALDGSAAILLNRKDTDYDVEYKPYKITSSGLPSILAGNMDQVVRQATFDIFGNPFTYSKVLHYGDGRQYTHNGPVSLFDACNRLVRLTDQLGQVENNEYDANGRLTTMTRYDGTKFNYTYDWLGRLLSSSSPDGTTAYKYLSNGRLTNITSGTATITHTYAPDGAIRTTLFPDGRSQTYALDFYSRVNREMDAAGRVTENTFDTFGRIGTKQMGSSRIKYHYGTINHTEHVYIGSSVTGSQPYNCEIAYDGFGRQNQVTYRNQDGSIVLKSDYLRNSRGYLASSQVSSQIHREAAVNNKRLFLYDGFGQLLSDSTSYEQDDMAAQTHEFKYDGNWNVIQKTTDGSALVFKYNALGQRQDLGFVYDTNGRLVSDPEGRKYHYDSEDRLTSVTYNKTTSYAYHPDSSLAKSATANTNTSFYYDGGAVNSTLDATGETETWTSYLLQPGRRVASEKGDKDITFFLDSQNSVVMSLGTGDTTTAYDYRAYGAATSNTARFGWQRELTDPDNGLIYLRSRYYQPEHMAFITMDSSRGQENRYAYCYGDPINLADGSGHDGAVIAGTIMGTVVGIVAGVLTAGLADMVVADVALIFGVTQLQMGIAAGSVSGAVSVIAGDGTDAAIQQQRFTVSRALEDLAFGAIGGVAGAGSGEAGVETVSYMAQTESFTRAEVTPIVKATANIFGGGVGGFTTTGLDAAWHRKPLSAGKTALDVLSGFISGAMGTYMGTQGDAQGTEADANPAVRAANPPDRENIPMDILGAENGGDGAIINNSSGSGSGELRAQVGGQEHFTNVPHGEDGRMPTQDPGQTNVDWVACHGGWSDAKRIADIVGAQVWAAYRNIVLDRRPGWVISFPRA